MHVAPSFWALLGKHRGVLLQAQTYKAASSPNSVSVAQEEAWLLWQEKGSCSQALIRAWSEDEPQGSKTVPSLHTSIGRSFLSAFVRLSPRSSGFRKMDVCGEGESLPLVGVVVAVEVQAAVTGGGGPHVAVLRLRRGCPQRRSPLQSPAHPGKSLQTHPPWRQQTGVRACSRFCSSSKSEVLLDCDCTAATGSPRQHSALGREFGVILQAFESQAHASIDLHRHTLETLGHMCAPVHVLHNKQPLLKS